MLSFLFSNFDILISFTRRFFFKGLEMDTGKLQKLELLLDQSKAFSKIIAETLLAPETVPETAPAVVSADDDAQQPPLKKQKTEPQQYSQPESVVNVTLKDHQIVGINWLINLFQNGLNGILADEMGLGKTLQTISLIAFLNEQFIRGPYLVVAPLNVVPNWALEFEKFTPSLKVLPYIGPKDKRTQLRRGGWKKHDVIITSYELAMLDFDYFKSTQWTYLVVDEGHRLKNFKSQLFSKLKELNCSNRLLLTGTPLQNNLVELWSLLNFILPSVFHDFHTFKNYFNFDEFEKLKDDDESDNTLINLTMKKALVTNLHTILKPFILRRLKKDVLKLPPKREFIVYSEHTPMQKILYSSLLNTSLNIGTKLGNSRKVVDREHASKTVRSTLIETFLPIYIKYNHPELNDSVKGFLKQLKSQEQEAEKRKPLNALDILMEKKKRRNEVDYDEDSSSYGELSGRKVEINKLELSPIYPHYSILLKHFKSKSVLNPLPMLRQVCDSPYLLCWPWEEDQPPLADDENESEEESISFDKDIDDEFKLERFNDLRGNTAKLQTLESLIPEILKQNPNERILIFSQFITTLKTLKIYFENHPTLKIKIERGTEIDIFPQDTLTLHGAHSIMERNEIFDEFSLRDENDELIGPKIFLLSTKAANLGLNLTIASTVILYDCDYNPTVDAQAIARVHRIGQKRQCLIYRLISKSTVEEIVVRKGEGKTWLADVVVESGKFDGLNEEDIKFNEKDSLMLTLYRLYKLVNRGESNVEFNGNELSQDEINELTNRDFNEGEELRIENLPRVRMFADPNLNGENGDDLPQF